MKILSFYILLLISCSNVRPKADAKHDKKDSIASQYIALADSFPYFDTTDPHYKLLKAHLNNDTSYIKKEAEDLGQFIKAIPKELLYDSCAKVPSLGTLGANEAYRFVFEEVFSAYKTNITVLQI